MYSPSGISLSMLSTAAIENPSSRRDCLIYRLPHASALRHLFADCAISALLRPETRTHEKGLPGGRLAARLLGLVEEVVDLGFQCRRTGSGASDPEDYGANLSFEIESLETGSAFLEVHLDLDAL